MSNKRIAWILDNHGIPHFEENDRIYADSMIVGTELFEQTDDLTGYTVGKLRKWLGY
jgi:hypothetical protein